MIKPLTTEEFIEKAKSVYGDKYDYSQVNYVNNTTKVKIICSEHGEFNQTPGNHLRWNGCSKCNKKDTKEFIKDAKKIHGNKYDYSLVDYKKNSLKVKIICPIHGEFLQFASNHLIGRGCRKCGYDSRTKTTEHFIKKAKCVHKNKYNYSLVDYKKNSLKVKIICPIHGEFNQTPRCHLQGRGCPGCSADKKKTTIDEFIFKANKVHKNKYDYSLTVYVGNKSKIKIICPIHGEFLQRPDCHLLGNGCPVCKFSKGEVRISNFFKKMNIAYCTQKRFDDCRDKRSLPFDLCIEKNNKHLLIEYHGLQHEKVLHDFGGEKDFKIRKYHDKIKQEYCAKNKIPLLIIWHKDFNNIEIILESFCKKHGVL